MFRAIDKSDSFADVEERVLKFWDKDHSFEKSLSLRKNAPEFVFYDGPPFATGLPHYGHLLAGTIKDIVPRYWSMKGFRVERRFGWDCHGLPIESLIQSELKLAGVAEIKDYGVDKFNEACRASVLRYTGEWEDTVRKMGRWVDFRDDYKTMDKDFMESVWWVFKQCYDLGLIYQGYRIQPYSPALATPLSNFETNQGYKDRQDPSLTVTLPLVDENAALLVWTTTPWTLPSNMAVALGPDIRYVLVEQKSEKEQKSKDGKKYWIAEKRMAAYFGDNTPVLETKTGRELAGKKYQPLFTFLPEVSGKHYTTLLADYVSTEDGTGAVHIAPSFGEEDFQLGQREGLGLFDPLDEQGRFTEKVPPWKGVGAKEADKAIIRALKEMGRVFKQDTMVHSYPHCYRTDVPLIYRALKTWFLKLDHPLTNHKGETKTLKEWMLSCNQAINWVPDHIKDGRFGKWLEGARDWNLARNRFWGTPIPVWQAADGDAICVGSVDQLEKLTGQTVEDLHMHCLENLELRTSDGVHHDPKGKLYRRTPEVLDCWFESGSMPYAQNHYPFENKEKLEQGFPADFIAEGLDQTRGWFYTLTVLGSALFQKPAFKNVIINGIILAENGQKMSKRLKNYPDPKDLIHRTSADAVRLFMINSPAVKAGDLKFSEAGVQEMTRSILLPLWNALSLFVTYANADRSKGQLTWKPGQTLESQNELDRWILSDLQELLENIQQEMDGFRLYNVVPAVVQFIDDLTNWYIRRSRRRFWKSENDTDKNAGYATLYRVLVDFSKVLAPILPFLAEEIYQILVHEVIPESPSSVHHCDFPMPDPALKDPDLVARMKLAREAVLLGRSIRAQHNLKNRQPLQSINIAVHDNHQEKALRGLIPLIREELNLKDVVISLDETAFVKFSAKANFKSLGKRMGKAMKAVAQQVAALDHNAVAKVLKENVLHLKEGDLTADDILVQREVPEGMAVESGENMTVALDIHISEELLQEGLARECVNKIQNLRKERNLDVLDGIFIEASSQSSLLKTAVEKHRDYIMNETLAKSMKILANPVEETEKREVEPLDSKTVVEYNGQNVSFAIHKIKK